MYKITITVDNDNIKIDTDADYKVLGIHCKGKVTSEGKPKEILDSILTYIENTIWLNESHNLSNEEETISKLSKIVDLDKKTIERILNITKSLI